MTPFDIVHKESRRVWVCRVSPSKAEELRRELNPKTRKWLKRCIAETCLPMKALPYGYTLHHKIPLMFGGNNHLDNFVLCHPIIHDLYHQYIEAMNPIDVPIGWTGYVHLPMPRHKALTPKMYGL